MEAYKNGQVEMTLAERNKYAVYERFPEVVKKMQNKVEIVEQVDEVIELDWDQIN